MTQPGPAHTNIHGRKWGRGWRPYLLLPKFLFVAIFVGGLISMLVQGFLLDRPETPDEWRRRGLLLTHSYVWVIVPGLLGAMAMGLLLLSSHFRAFIRMRWFQLKLALILICVPSLHFYMRAKATALHTALARGGAEDLRRAADVWRDLRAGTIASILFAFTIVLLGRIKPRLGQDYARTFGRRSPANTIPPTPPPPQQRS